MLAEPGRFNNLMSLRPYVVTHRGYSGTFYARARARAHARAQLFFLSSPETLRHGLFQSYLFHHENHVGPGDLLLVSAACWRRCSSPTESTSKPGTDGNTCSAVWAFAESVLGTDKGTRTIICVAY